MRHIKLTTDQSPAYIKMLLLNNDAERFYQLAEVLKADFQNIEVNHRNMFQSFRRDLPRNITSLPDEFTFSTVSKVQSKLGVLSVSVFNTYN